MERNHHRRARLRSNRRVDVVASTRRRVFSARQFSPSHFFRVDEFPFAVTTSFSRERGLEKRVPERNDATVERASDAQKRVVRYRLVSIPAVLALFRRGRRSRTPSPVRTHARATTIVVSMSRIVAQKRVLRKKKEREKGRRREPRDRLFSLPTRTKATNVRETMPFSAGFVEDGC